VLETVERARMSGASGMRVDVTASGADLVVRLEVVAATTEFDVSSVTDRIEAAGGTTTVDARPGGPTTITNLVPVTVLEPA
jgi:signal transduction histidine kinase